MESLGPVQAGKVAWKDLFPEGSKSKAPKVPALFYVFTHSSLLHGVLFTTLSTLKSEATAETPANSDPKGSCFSEQQNVVGAAHLT